MVTLTRASVSLAGRPGSTGEPAEGFLRRAQHQLTCPRPFRDGLPRRQRRDGPLLRRGLRRGLTSDGQLEKSFGDHGWTVIPQLAGSYETDLFALKGGLLVAGFVMYTGCGGPVLARLATNGHADQAFAVAVGRSVKTAMPGYAIHPDLYLGRGGAFALVGG